MKVLVCRGLIKVKPRFFVFFFPLSCLPKWLSLQTLVLQLGWEWKIDFLCGPCTKTTSVLSFFDLMEIKNALALARNYIIQWSSYFPCVTVRYWMKWILLCHYIHYLPLPFSSSEHESGTGSLSSVEADVPAGIYLFSHIIWILTQSWHPIAGSLKFGRKLSSNWSICMDNLEAGK